MKTSEASIQSTLKHALETCGYFVGEVAKARSAKAAGLWTGTTAGLPDLFITHPDWPEGQWLGLELKTPQGRLREAQAALNEQGRTVVVRSVYAGLRAVIDSEIEMLRLSRTCQHERHHRLMEMCRQFDDGPRAVAGGGK